MSIRAALPEPPGCRGAVLAVVRESGRPAEHFFIQDHGGTSRSIAKGKEVVARFKGELQATPRTEMTLGHREFFIPCKHQDTPALTTGCRA